MKYAFLRSIRAQLIVLVLVAILPAFAIVIYSGIQRDKDEMEHARSSALRIAENIAFEHERTIESTRQFLMTLSKIPEFQSPYPQLGHKILADLLKQNPLYGNIFILDRQGHIIASALPAKTLNRASEKFFRDAVQTQTFSIGEYAFSEIVKRPVLHLAYPVWMDKDRLEGVIAVSLDIAHYAEAYSKANLPAGSILTLIDHRGTVLFRHPGDPIDQPRQDIPEMIQRMNGPDPTGSFTFSGPDHVKYLTVFKSLRLKEKSRPYTFIRISIPEDEALFAARVALTLNLLLLGIAFLIAMAIARSLGNAIVVKKLNQLVRASRNLGRGDLSTRTGLDYGNGELGELARAFDEMAEAVESKNIEARSAEAKSARIAEELKTTFDAITDQIMLLNPEYKLTRANRATTRFLNLPFRSIMGQTCFELMHKSSEPPDFCPLRKMMKTKCHEEAEVYDADRGVWLQLSVDPILDETGNVTQIVHIVKDISDRRAHEELLRVSEERYRMLFNESPVALLELNGSGIREYLDSLHRSGVNDFRAYFKKHKANLPSGQGLISIANANRASLELYQVLDKNNLIRNLSLAFTADLNRVGLESLIALSEGIFEYESDVVFTSAQGETLHIHLRWTVPSDCRASLDKILVSFLDITGRKRAEETIHNQRQRFENILENAPFGIVIMDRFGKGNFANSKYREIFGYGINEFPDWQSWSVQAYPDPEHRKQVFREWIHALKTAKPGEKFISYTQPVMCKGGARKDTSISCVLLNSQEILFILEDVTEQKRLEAQLMQSQKMTAIGTLAGGIAHDFNNLLMTILGYTSLILMDTKPGASHYDKLKTIERQVQSGSGLTRQLLGFARGGKYEIKIVDLNEILSRSAEMFGRTKQEIAIEKKFEKNLWPVEVDVSQIEQVFLNLFVNAWHAMPSGGEIYLTTSNMALETNRADLYALKAGQYVRISITDTGMGMDEATRQRIFEPFFTTKEMGRGSGLGLASAYGIIKNHGGSITVYSEKGKGTNFNLYLPASEKALQTEKERPQAVLEGTEAILLVDDQEPVLNVGKQMLEMLGYTVFSAESGRAALSRYQQDRGKINLVILDMIMPLMSGGETYTALKEINPDIKVILSSGYSMNGDAVKILDQGCNGFIQKPFTLAELSSKVREVLGANGVQSSEFEVQSQNHLELDRV